MKNIHMFGISQKKWSKKSIFSTGKVARISPRILFCTPYMYYVRGPIIDRASHNQILAGTKSTEKGAAFGFWLAGTPPVQVDGG